MKAILIGVAVLAAGIALRQTNTVPDRTLVNGNKTICKVDDIFGSSYHGFYKGEDIGISSKVFSDVEKSWEGLARQTMAFKADQQAAEANQKARFQAERAKAVAEARESWNRSHPNNPYQD